MKIVYMNLFACDERFLNSIVMIFDQELWMSLMFVLQLVSEDLAGSYGGMFRERLIYIF